MNTRKNTILVISHNSELHRNIESCLGTGDYDYIVVGESHEAMDRIAYQVPGIIIYEPHSSDNSYNLCSSIRNSIKTRLIPIIVILSSNAETDRITAIEKGADAYVVRPFPVSELVAHIKTKLFQFNEFYLLSITDELTRLFNRREFLKKFNEITSNDPSMIVSLAILDLDFFKQVNDIHGHQMGDTVLMKFAEILKSFLSDSFFPTRFGGEEFVVLMPGIEAAEARKIIDNIRELLYSYDFKGAQNQHFHVSFSAGISQYPVMGQNLSVMLSKADQALYSAKADGRARSYVFNPVMARNDSFWEHLKKNKGFFIDSRGFDAVTGIPYLPHILETISNLDYDINSIGVLIIRLVPVSGFLSIEGTRNLDFILEDIRFLLLQSCENYFASDTYISLSDTSGYEFTVLFPSFFDFSLNVKKCKVLYHQIINDFTRRVEYYPVDIMYASSVFFYSVQCPRCVLYNIHDLSAKSILATSRQKNIDECSTELSERLVRSESIDGLIGIEKIFNLESGAAELSRFYLSTGDNQCYSLKYHFDQNRKTSLSLKTVESLFSMIDFSSPAVPVIPFIDSIDISHFIGTVTEGARGNEIYVAINEQLLDRKFVTMLNSQLIPANIRFALSGCFIGSDILNTLSAFDFSMVMLSEFLIRNLHFFKMRIKIINGLKIFLDQMDIRVCAMNVLCEEEYQLIRDLDIPLACGRYIERKNGLLPNSDS
jgi:diguanylate cyclase (GGDEF)-like protein